MTSREDIALQLTLKSIDRMHTSFSTSNSSKNNEEFSKQVVDFYNHIYQNLNIDENSKSNNCDNESITII